MGGVEHNCKTISIKKIIETKEPEENGYIITIGLDSSIYLKIGKKLSTEKNIDSILLSLKSILIRLNSMTDEQISQIEIEKWMWENL